MKKRNWFWGIFFLLSAVFLVASQIYSFAEVGFVSILGTVLLVAIMVQSIIHRSFIGIFVPAAFLYEIYSKPLGLMDVSVWLLLLSAVLASIGLGIIFNRRPRYRMYRKNHVNNWQGCCDKGGSVEKFTSSTETIDDNAPYSRLSFGSSSKYLHGTAIKSGQFIVSFGELDVYFDQAQLDPAGAEIYLDCRFGELALYIPRSWNVKDSIQAGLGVVTNDTKSVHADPAAPLLTLKGNVSLGEIGIHYI